MSMTKKICPPKNHGKVANVSCCLTKYVRQYATVCMINILISFFQLL